jgi:hypothetical protein
MNKLLSDVVEQSREAARLARHTYSHIRFGWLVGVFYLLLCWDSCEMNYAGFFVRAYSLL